MNHFHELCDSVALLLSVYRSTRRWKLAPAGADANDAYEKLCEDLIPVDEALGLRAKQKCEPVGTHQETPEK